jgi:transposase
MTETITFTRLEPGRRRRFTLEQKRALLLAAEAPGATISSVARQHGLQASMLFGWRRAMENGEEKGLESGEDVVPASQLRQAEAKIRELERLLGKKTVQVEILEEAVRIAREKKLISPGKSPKPGGGR